MRGCGEVMRGLVRVRGWGSFAGPSSARIPVIHYELSGEGPLVVFLHGLGGSSADWGPQRAVFARDHRVLTVDLRGHGASRSDTVAWNMADMAADVAEVLRAVGGTPAHVCGLSLGGMVAFQLAVDHPALVRSLAIVNSGPAFPSRTWKGRLLLWMRRRTVRRRGLAPLGASIAKGLFPRPDQADARRAFEAHFVTNDPAAYLATLAAIGSFDVAARVPGLRVPVLAICGDRDYTPVATKEAWVRTIPGARLEVIPASGHATPVDQPEPFNRVLLAFWS